MKQNLKCKSSDIWKFFTINEEELNTAECDRYKMKFSRGPVNTPRNFSTTPLFNRLKKYHMDDYELLSQEKQKRNTIINGIQEKNRQAIFLKFVNGVNYGI